MRNIRIERTIFDPASGQFDNYFEFCKARAGEDISAYRSSFTVSELPRKILYERTLAQDASFDFSGDITIMRIPTIYDEEKREQKAGSPFLETENTITCTAVLRREDISGIPPDDILRFYESLIADIVSRYGEAAKMEIRNNDMYYGGKKFGGIEATMGDTMTIASCITLRYLPDKALIDGLSGRGTYDITGILEEVPGLSRETLIGEMVSGIRGFFEEA